MDKHTVNTIRELATLIRELPYNDTDADVLFESYISEFISLFNNTSTTARNKKIIAMYDKGISDREIGRHFNITHGRVRQIINHELYRRHIKDRQRILDEKYKEHIRNDD